LNWTLPGDDRSFACMSGPENSPTATTNFIEEIINEDLAQGKNQGRVHTRFPPEPNGYLHIGHAKSICLNFGLAAKYAGKCNLRYDDTNPSTEDVEYVESIEEDVAWLGFRWNGQPLYASDYFDEIYRLTEILIENGKAYVDDLSAEQISEYRGNFYKPGQDSPFRNRAVAENLDLFRRMRAGEFADGSRVLRAKIDMRHPNLNMRDPPLYRIKRATHHRTGDKWCIYPMYDYAHPISDALEGITHSVCTLEFEDHRPLYDWTIENLPLTYRPRQIEFARLNLTYTLMSKRKLLQLVEEKLVSGWNDPRMPSLSGLRRRGYTPEAIRAFAERIGVAKNDSIIDVGLLEFAIREDLEKRAPRAMAVLRPLKVVIDNYPEGQVDWFEAANHPDDPAMGKRKIPFSKVVYIERDDFAEVPPKKWFRLSPGAEIRLRWACLIKCVSVVKNAAGEIEEVHCTWDPNSRGGDAPDGRRVKGTSHWVSAAHAKPASVRLYDRLVHQGQSNRGWRGFSHLPQSQFPASGGRRPDRAVVDRGRTRQPLPVRATGLLLCGHRRFQARPARVQPHRAPARFLGETGRDRKVGALPVGPITLRRRAAPLDGRRRDPESHHRGHRGHRGRKERVPDPGPNPSFLPVRLCDLCALCGEIRGKLAETVVRQPP
jgi:glutaminyl-tRNA synthetase